MKEPEPLIDYAGPLGDIEKAASECYKQLEQEKSIPKAQAELLKMAKGIREVQRWIDEQGKKNAEKAKAGN